MDIIRDSFSKNKYGTMKYRTTDRREPAWDLMGVVDDVVSVERYFSNNTFGHIPAANWSKAYITDYDLESDLGKLSIFKSYIESNLGLDLMDVEKGELLDYLEEKYPEVVGAYDELLSASETSWYSYIEFANRVGWKYKEGMVTGFGAFEGNHYVELTVGDRNRITVFEDALGTGIALAVLLDRHNVKTVFQGIEQTEITFRDGSVFKFYMDFTLTFHPVGAIANGSVMPEMSSALGVYEFIQGSGIDKKIESLMQSLQNIGD